MPVKVTMNTRLKASNLQAIRTDFYMRVLPALQEAIVTNLIKRGISPVEGWGRYQQYSDSYIASMGATRVSSAKTGKTSIKRTGASRVKGTDNKYYTDKKPGKVNLTVSGTMLDTFKAGIDGAKIKAKFSSKFAKFHDDGIKTKRGIVRRPLLPSKDGETFSKTIMRWLVKEASTSVDAQLKKK